MTVSLLVAAFVAFSATTIDDLIIVKALFTSSRATSAPLPCSIALCFVAIVAASLAAAERLRDIPTGG